MRTPSTTRLPTRRAVVTGLATTAVLAMTGCSPDGDLPDLPGLDDEQPDPDPDLALVRRVSRDEQEVLDLVSATRKTHRELRAPLAGTARGHRAHLDLVRVADGGPTRRGRAATVAEQPGRALEDVVRAERMLADRHAGSALEADSGRLARAIASMSAAAAQQGSVLGTAAGGRS